VSMRPQASAAGAVLAVATILFALLAAVGAR
jgi:hypothetical protein